MYLGETPPAESECLDGQIVLILKTVGKPDFHRACLQSEREQISPLYSIGASSLNLLAEVALRSPIASDDILITRKLAGK